MKDSRSRWREPSEPRRAGTETLARCCKSTQPGARRLTSPALGSETCGSYPSLALGKTGKVRAAFAKAPARPLRQEALGGAREGRNCEPRAPRLHPRLTEVHTPGPRERVKKKTGRKERKKNTLGGGDVLGLSPAGVARGPRGHSGSGASCRRASRCLPAPRGEAEAALPPPLGAASHLPPRHPSLLPLLNGRGVWAYLAVGPPPLSPP